VTPPPTFEELAAFVRAVAASDRVPSVLWVPAVNLRTRLDGPADHGRKAKR
jgi:hypothetical protein